MLATSSSELTALVVRHHNVAFRSLNALIEAETPADAATVVPPRPLGRPREAR
jgi:hypothetical protein